MHSVMRQRVRGQARWRKVPAAQCDIQSHTAPAPTCALPASFVPTLRHVFAFPFLLTTSNYFIQYTGFCDFFFNIVCVFIRERFSSTLRRIGVFVLLLLNVALYFLEV